MERHGVECVRGNINARNRSSRMLKKIPILTKDFIALIRVLTIGQPYALQASYSLKSPFGFNPVESKEQEVFDAKLFHNQPELKRKLDIQEYVHECAW